MTKTDLQRELARVEAENTQLKNEINLLTIKLDSLKQMSIGGLTSSLVISAERIATAAAQLSVETIKLQRR